MHVYNNEATKRRMHDWNFVNLPNTSTVLVNWRVPQGPSALTIWHTKVVETSFMLASVTRKVAEALSNVIESDVSWSSASGSGLLQLTSSVSPMNMQVSARPVLLYRNLLECIKYSTRYKAQSTRFAHAPRLGQAGRVRPTKRLLYIWHTRFSTGN